MTVNSFFHNSVNGDRLYEADDFAAHTKTIISDGVVEGLSVTYTSAYAYTIDVGKAIVMGRSVINDAIISTAIGTPVSGDVYSVVVRMDLATRSASIETILGTSYQDDNAIKQIPLATILVGTNTLTITDQRSYVAFKSNKISLNDSNIKYNTDLTEFVAMMFKEGSDNATGVGMSIGTGGTTIIGGGESAHNIMVSPLIPDASQEKLILSSDFSAEIWTDMQNVVADGTVGKRFIFNANGDFNIGGTNADTSMCTLRYTGTTKTLAIWHWTGTAVSDTVILEVGDIDFQNSPWISLPLSGSVIDYSASNDVQYQRKGNIVFLRGAVKNVLAVNTTIGYLPVGYRPKTNNHVWAAPMSGNNFARWVVRPDGEIEIEGAQGAYGAEVWFPLNTCFSVD